jgi:hypothetical protein
MRTPQIRRCTLLDAMVLVAATAIGLSLARTYSQEALNNNLESYPLFPKVLLSIWAAIVAVLPVPAMWSIALFGLGLRQPRPVLRRLVRQPGIVAAGAVTLVAAIRLVGFITLIARTPNNRFYTLGVSFFEAFAVRISYPGPTSAATLYNSAYFASSAFGVSMAVAAGWLLLFVSGRWRSEPVWIERFGRALGVFWIAIIPFSCWWDYHVLY